MIRKNFIRQAPLFVLALLNSLFCGCLTAASGGEQVVSTDVLQRYEAMLAQEIKSPDLATRQRAERRLLAFQLYGLDVPPACSCEYPVRLDGTVKRCLLAWSAAESLGVPEDELNAIWNSREAGNSNNVTEDNLEVETQLLSYLDPQRLNARLHAINRRVYEDRLLDGQTTFQDVEALKREEGILLWSLRNLDNHLNVSDDLVANNESFYLELWKGLNRKNLLLGRCNRVLAHKRRALTCNAARNPAVSDARQSVNQCYDAVAEFMAQEQLNIAINDTVEFFVEDHIKAVERARKDLFGWYTDWMGVLQDNHPIFDRLNKNMQGAEICDNDDWPFPERIQVDEQEAQKFMVSFNQALKKHYQHLKDSTDPKETIAFNGLVGLLKSDKHFMNNQFFDTLLQGIEEIDESPKITPPVETTGTGIGGGDSNPPIHGPGGTSQRGFWSAHKWHFVIGTTLLCVVAVPTAFAVAYKKAWLPKKLQAWTERMLAKFKRRRQET